MKVYGQDELHDQNIAAEHYYTHAQSYRGTTLVHRLLQSQKNQQSEKHLCSLASYCMSQINDYKWDPYTGT